MNIRLKNGKTYEIDRLNCNLYKDGKVVSIDSFLLSEKEVSKSSPEEIVKDFTMENISEVVYIRADGSELKREYIEVGQLSYTFSDTASFLSANLIVKNHDSNENVSYESDVLGE